MDERRVAPNAGALPLEVLLRHEVKCLSVHDDDALHAMAAAFSPLKLVVEPAGAALATVLGRKADFAGNNVAVVCSGGNVDPAVVIGALARLDPQAPRASAGQASRDARR